MPTNIAMTQSARPPKPREPLNRDNAAGDVAAAPVTVLIVISTHIVGGPAKGLLQLIPLLKVGGRVRPLLCTFHRIGAPPTPFIAACREHGIDIELLPQRHNFDLRALRGLRDLVARERVDIVQTHGYKENLFGLFLKLFVRKPWVCVMHGTTDENIKVRLYHALDAHLVRRADRIVSVSPELTQRMLPRAYRARAHLVENAIAPLARTPNGAAAVQWKRRYNIGPGAVISCIGRLSPEKGQDILLEAARLLRARGHAFQLVFVGDGPTRADLEERMLVLGLAGAVHFVGQQQEMDVVYRATDVLVLPSRKEGMPNVILEAMLHGLPIVSTQVGAVPAMLRADIEAALVPVGDAQALAGALERVIADPQFAAALGRAAHKALFPRFSLEQRVRNMEGVYRQALKEAL